MSSLLESVTVSGQHVLLAAQKLSIQPSLTEHREELIAATQNVFLGVVKVQVCFSLSHPNTLLNIPFNLRYYAFENKQRQGERERFKSLTRSNRFILHSCIGFLLSQMFP